MPRFTPIYASDDKKFGLSIAEWGVVMLFIPPILEIFQGFMLIVAFGFLIIGIIAWAQIITKYEQNAVNVIMANSNVPHVLSGYSTNNIPVIEFEHTDD